jgi:hypothetical protein
MAGSVHAVKSVAIRPVVGVATGGMGNVPVSMAEDATSTTLSVLSITFPIAVFILVVLFLSWGFWFLFLKKPKNSEIKED